MKPIRFSILACFALSATFLTSAYGNHRTGTFALPELLVAGDFNGDGKLDLAVNVTGFDNVATLLGDGLGGFNLKGHVATDTLPKGLAVGDVDNDGHLDLVTANNWGYTLLLHLGDGLGGFSSANILNGDGEPVRLVLKDFNKDGRLDIAVGAPEEGKLLLYLGAKVGAFSVPATEFEDLSSPFGIAAGDFNRDTNLDIALASVKSATGSHVSILLGDGAGGFSVKSEFAVNNLPTSVQVGDLNGDGILDLVVAGAQPTNPTGNFVSTYLGNGRGIFALKQTKNLGPGSLKGEIALGDFNEDGKLDVAFPKTSSQVQHEKSHIVFIFFGDGTGNLVTGPSVDVGNEPHTVITADFNKDGHLDLAVSNRSDGTVSVLLGNGSGSFTLSTTVSVISP